MGQVSTENPMPSPAQSSIGWYVHLPFCTTKCGYCDFYSLPTIPGLIDRLIDALKNELAQRNPRRPVETIFIGGGTPTVLPAEALETILRFVTEGAGPVCEFTVEANPSSTNELKLNLLCQYGVNRVSFGAQSFNRDDLAVLERIHDPRHIHESVHAARNAGFKNINLDLIYGIPGQTPERWRETLQTAVDLETEHLSCYALMFEPGTTLTRLRNEGRMLPCDEDREAEMFDLTIDVLAGAGFEHYEISNFAKPGRRCRSNVVYWENREYLGIGPSAVSYLDGERRKNIADVRRYVEGMGAGSGSVAVECERLEPVARAAETAIQMLRLTDGVRFVRFSTLTGFDARELFSKQIERFAVMGLIEADFSGFRLTRPGMLVANRVMEDFLQETPFERCKSGSRDRADLK